MRYTVSILRGCQRGKCVYSVVYTIRYRVQFIFSSMVSGCISNPKHYFWTIYMYNVRKKTSRAAFVFNFVNKLPQSQRVQVLLMCVEK